MTAGNLVDELQDRLRLTRQDVPVVLEVTQAQMPNQSRHPIACFARPQHHVLASNDDLHRHRERGELGVGSNRNPFEARTEVLEDRLEY